MSEEKPNPFLDNAEVKNAKPNPFLEEEAKKKYTRFVAKYKSFCVSARHYKIRITICFDYIRINSFYTGFFKRKD